MNRIARLARSGKTGSRTDPAHAQAPSGSWRGVALLSVALVGGFAAVLMMSGGPDKASVEGMASKDLAPAAQQPERKDVAPQEFRAGASNVDGVNAANVMETRREAAGGQQAQAVQAESAPNPEGGSPSEQAFSAGWTPVAEEPEAFRLAPLPQMPGTAALKGLMAMTGVIEGVSHVSGGGRDDALIIGDPDAPGALLRLSLYRPGSEKQPGGSFFVDVARRAGEASMWVERFAQLPPVETRLGPVDIAVTRFEGKAGLRSCLVFRQIRSEPDLRLSGWVCLAGDMAPAPEAAACIIDSVRWQRDQQEPKIAGLLDSAGGGNSICAQPAGDLTSSIRPVEGGQAPKRR